MAITKTKFINYIRCPRYVALDDLKKEELNSDISYDDYKKEELEQNIKEIINEIYDEEGNDLIDVKDPQLEVMLPYYNKVEELSGINASKYFKGSFKYALNTREQESFDCKINGIRYLCYVDILNTINDNFNIIEVKATTSKKFLNIGKTINKEFKSIFEKREDGIYYLNEFDPKLFDRLNSAGHYIYDLAVQRYIIENDLKQNNMTDKIDKIKYYLSVLNADYVYDGISYKTDINGNDIVTYFDLTDITKEYLDIIDIDRKKIEKYIHELNVDPVFIGEFCENKKTTKCKFMPICWKNIPKKNSILNYLDSHYGFKDGEIKYNCFELINNGVIDMLDLDDRLLNRRKNQIQKQVTKDNIPYINIPKIKDGIKCIKYPIYHLDFETFPCPLPRFKGEHCYTQSVFQFSLHIENDTCDKEKDHYGYLAIDNNDHREELIKELIKYITDFNGTILVYNESFEKTRLKELSIIFPRYKEQLDKMRNMIFDLMNIVKTKSSLYKELGYDNEEASLFNYYHKDMSGSFSIKKILPLFSDLSYKDMEIGNGVQALVTYANFPKMSKKEFERKYNLLIEYCKQDTWAMVEILKGLKQL